MWCELITSSTCVLVNYIQADFVRGRSCNRPTHMGGKKYKLAYTMVDIQITNTGYIRFTLKMSWCNRRVVRLSCKP